jgi:hypothetical protein
MNTDRTYLLNGPHPCSSQFKTCWECTTQKTVFSCVWCPALKRCSNTINGLDRNYQVSAFFAAVAVVVVVVVVTAAVVAVAVANWKVMDSTTMSDTAAVSR